MKTNSKIVYRKEFDGSALLFDPELGETFGLNRTSAFLWEKFAEGMSETEAIDALKNVCKNMPQSAEDELKAFVGQLKAKNFILD